MTGGRPSLAIVLGTRPEIIKLSPIIAECDRRKVAYTLVHTGQHYSNNLDQVFFDQLELPPPDYHLEIGSGSHGEQTGKMLQEIEGVLNRESPDITIVQGDTNSTMAGALASAKGESDLAHVEAGLRSFDKDMPEEMNRTLTDHAADYLFPPTEQAADYLRNEGLSNDAITVTGNTIVDAVQSSKQLAWQKSSVLEQLDVEPGNFLLLTAHRAENVDNEQRFATLLSTVGQFADEMGMEAIYPIHPRAEEKLEAFGLTPPDRIELVDPLDFLDFLLLEDLCELVLTDSGGVQEEACILRTPCVTLRDNTERPETVATGSNEVVGVEPDTVIPVAQRMIDTPTDWAVPFGDGDAAPRILDTLGAVKQIEVRG